MSQSNPIANLQIMTKCPMCDFKYGQNDVKMVEKKQGTISLHMNCKQCKSSIMMIILAGALGITSVSVMTDIMENEVGNNNSLVDYDDVLEIHKFLEDK